MVALASLAHTDAVVVLLLGLTALVGVLAPWIKVPATVGLVVAGLLINILGLFRTELSPDLVYFVLLPIVIFEASFNLDQQELIADWPRTLTLSFPGVAVVAALVALGLRGLGQSWTVALLFAAIVAATDSVSVVAVFRDIKTAARLKTVIEAESIMNNGTGAVVFALVLAAITGGHASAPWALGKLVWMTGAGLGVGALFALVALGLHRLVDDWKIELTFSLMLAYASFVSAEAIGASGPLAGMAAGFLLGNWGHRWHVMPMVRDTMKQFWEYGSFLVNGMVFLLVGLTMNWKTVLHSWPLILAAFALTLAARAVIVYGYEGLARLFGGALPMVWNHVLWLGGLRGTITLALLFTVPLSIPGIATVRALTFGTVLCSLLVQGLLTPDLTRRLISSAAAGTDPAGTAGAVAGSATDSGP